MRIYSIAFLLVCVGWLWSCSNPNQPAQNTDSSTVVAPAAKPATDMDADCAKPTKYPNQDKPMALMMRQMADDAQKMKDLVLAGKLLEAKAFPFMRFHLVEPTDPNILQPQFFENARLLQVAHKNLMAANAKQQPAMYTAYINQCINCHQVYCSGPLKRIRKLTLQ